ncbi:MAG: hypothetical protein V3V33_04035 [Candidatus Lokiarchaeia archaeon]
MEEFLDKKAEVIIKENIKNIELINFFTKSTVKTPVFLSIIQRNYAEIKPLLNRGLVKDLKPVKSYIFNLDKLENYFYSIFQEKIDFLKNDIWRKKRKKTEIIKKTEGLTPEEGCEDYDLKLCECLEFAKKAIAELDTMEIDKEDFNNIIGGLQEKMKQDPIYKFLLFVRNDKDIVFNKRTEDNPGIIHKKILIYSEECMSGKGWSFFSELKKKEFYKEFSPAKNYFITELGLLVDSKLRERKWSEEVDYQKTKEEIFQEEEFNKLKKQFDI